MGVSELLSSWKRVLGSRAVVESPAKLEHYLKDIAGFELGSHVRVVASLHPEDAGSVQAVVEATRAAASAGSRVSLHAISTGRNWGLGSRVPPETANGGDDGMVQFVAVVDLARLNAVGSLDIGPGGGVAVVEPGVTLRQLADAISEKHAASGMSGASPYFINTTASCAHTSVLGNAIDRGVGFERQRTRDLLGLEVVTATGERVRLGSFWHAAKDDDAHAFHYAPGVGPDLTQAFVQSNFGIATAAAVELVPAPECRLLLVTEFLATDLLRATAALQTLYTDGVLSTVAKIYNEAALANYGVEDVGTAGGVDVAQPSWGQGGFRLFGSIEGPHAVADAKERIVLERLGKAGCFRKVQTFTAAELSSPAADTGNVEAFMRFCGEPTCDGHRRAFGPSCDLDRVTERGWIFFVPVVPFKPADVQNAVNILKSVGASAAKGEYGDGDVVVGATLNILGPRCVDLVTSVHFTKSGDAKRAAHKVLDELHDRCRAHGYFSYREDVAHMTPYGDPSYAALLCRLKRSLDPLSLFAPGRYVPDTKPPSSVDGTLHKTAAEWEMLAASRLHPVIYKYFSYTSGRGATVDASERALGSLRLRSRCLGGLGDDGAVDTSVTLFGVKFASPIIVAPTAMHGMLHPEAERGTALGAAAAGACYAVNGLLSNTPISEIQAIATEHGGRTTGGNWLHVYVYKERSLTERLVRRARDDGFSAVVVTSDHPTERITDLFVPEFIKHADELPKLRLPNMDPSWRPGDPLLGTNDGALTWECIDWLRTLTDLPIVVKGISCVEDAKLSAKHGAAGVVVSNHGGRQLDGGVPAIEALPSVVHAVGKSLKVFVDSGFRTGGDVLRAMALGADGVLVGRPVLWGLAAAGGRGVESVLSTMAAELRSDMANCACASLNDVDESILSCPPAPGAGWIVSKL